MPNQDTIYACNQHVEIALDDFINKYEKAPEIFETFNKKFKCSYCEKNAKYVIKFFEEKEEK